MSLEFLVRRSCSICQKFAVSNVSPVNARASATQKIKRFYKEVNVQKCISEGNNSVQSEAVHDIGTKETKSSPLGFNILLDKRLLKSPGGKRVTLSSEALALSKASEWMAQTEYILPATMHFTSLVNTCIDNPL